ncbi:unnamed protein product [Schistosoma bovis]|nr:unnamed protein product [Schistosoma bovis]
MRQFSQFSYENANSIPSQPINLPFSQVQYSSAAMYEGKEEDYENEPPLLEELGINFSHIVQKTSSVLLPFKESSQEVLDDTDLAGPLVFCLLFGCTLMFAGKIHFNYIYGLGVFGCLGIYLLLSVMTPRGVTPTCVISTLGYCLLPMCLLSSFGIVFSLKLEKFRMICSLPQSPEKVIALDRLEMTESGRAYFLSRNIRTRL